MLARHPQPAPILAFPALAGRETPDLASAILAHLDDQWQPRSLDAWMRLLVHQSRATIHRMLQSLEACGRIEVMPGTGTRPAAYRLASSGVCHAPPQPLEARVAELEQLVAALHATVEQLRAASHARETQDHIPPVVSHSVSRPETQPSSISSPETQEPPYVSLDETQHDDEDAFEALIRAQLEGKSSVLLVSHVETQATRTLNVNVNESDSLNVDGTNVDGETQTPVAILKGFGLTERQAGAAVSQHQLTVSEAETWVRWGRSLHGVRSPVAVVVSKLHQQRLPPSASQQTGPHQRSPAFAVFRQTEASGQMLCGTV